MTTATTHLGDRRRLALERTATQRRHPTARAKRRAPAGPPPVAFYVIVVVVALLVLLGLVMVLSASSITSFHAGESPWRFFSKQVTWAVLGTVGALIAYRVPYHWWRRLATPFLVVAGAAMFLPFVPSLGTSVNGARAWIHLGSMSFQPSELLKLAVLLFCADLLSRRATEMADLRRTLWPCLWVLAGAALLCLAQMDLGTAIVLGAIVLAVAFIGGTPFVPLTLTAGVLAAASTAFALSSERRRRRWTAFLDLAGNKDHYGYQVYQSMLSIANGGPTGVGVGAGSGKWGYVPLAHSDFIFAIVAEELGLVGVVAVLGGFMLLTFFGIQVALAARDRFGTLIAGGITTWFAVQAVINVGGVTGMIPVTGLTLPLISYGGSSLLTSLIAAGLLLNVARNIR
jgi:cell division protein FtsW